MKIFSCIFFLAAKFIYNISGGTYQLVKDKFNCIHRGKIQAKNKGEMDIYFVEPLPEPLFF